MRRLWTLLIIPACVGFGLPVTGAVLGTPDLGLGADWLSGSVDSATLAAGAFTAALGGLALLSTRDAN